MSKTKNIVVGLAARNEEENIIDSLSSIKKAILYTNLPSVKLAICLNGCVDRTPELAQRFQKENPDIDCVIINSEEGLVSAQRKIVQQFPADVYVFSDADSVIDKKSISLLLAELDNNPQTIVAYAKTTPLLDKTNKSIFHKIALLYDSQELLTKRYYFHGRLFATKEWFFPDSATILKRAMASKYTRELLRYCKKDILLFADDIFMSSYFIHQYGLQSIKQVEAVRCYSWSVGSLIDWFNAYRRRNIEMEKMYRWFPEYNYLKPYLNRKTDRQKWLLTSWKNKILWLIYLIMKTFFYLYLKYEL